MCQICRLADEICVFTYSRVCNFFGAPACKGGGARNNAVSSAHGKMAMQNECSRTVGGLIDWCAGALADAEVFCGHGTETYRDESASLVFHVAGLNHTGETESYSLPIDANQFRERSLVCRSEVFRRRTGVDTPFAVRGIDPGGFRALDRRCARESHTRDRHR
jgi:hypothetical protein